MKNLLLILSLFCIVSVWSDHLIVGNVSNKVILANHTKVEYNAIPFMKRVKYFFYTQTDNRLIQANRVEDTMECTAMCPAWAEYARVLEEAIGGGDHEPYHDVRASVRRMELYTVQGIQALDTLHSKSSINITAGGVGYSYVNLRLKSERGRGLNYDIGIYVQDYFYH